MAAPALAGAPNAARNFHHWPDTGTLGQQHSIIGHGGYTPSPGTDQWVGVPEQRAGAPGGTAMHGFPHAGCSYGSPGISPQWHQPEVGLTHPPSHAAMMQEPMQQFSAEPLVTPRMSNGQVVSVPVQVLPQQLYWNGAPPQQLPAPGSGQFRPCGHNAFSEMERLAPASSRRDMLRPGSNFSEGGSAGSFPPKSRNATLGVRRDRLDDADGAEGSDVEHFDEEDEHEDLHMTQHSYVVQSSPYRGPAVGSRSLAEPITTSERRRTADANQRVRAAERAAATALRRAMEAEKRVSQTAVETNQFKKRYAEADKAREAAESDVRVLEKHADKVLLDCQALQEELERERAKSHASHSRPASRHQSRSPARSDGSNRGARSEPRSRREAGDENDIAFYVRRLRELETELDTLRNGVASGSGNARADRERNLELETQLAETVEAQSAQVRDHNTRIAEMQEKLDAAVSCENNLQSRTADLEVQVAQSAVDRADFEVLRRENEDLQRRLLEAERNSAVAGEKAAALDARVAREEASRRDAERLLQAGVETWTKDHQHSMNRLETELLLADSRRRDAEDKHRKTEDHVSTMLKRLQAPDATARGNLSDVPTGSMKISPVAYGSGSRVSEPVEFQGGSAEQGIQDPSQTLTPASLDGRISEVRRQAAEALNAAAAANVEYLKVQLADWRNQRRYGGAAAETTEKMRQATLERQPAATAVAAVVRSLAELRASITGPEAAQGTAEKQDHLAEDITLAMQLCRDELQQLLSNSTAKDVPEDVREALVSLAIGTANGSKALTHAEKMSRPMHWAAVAGRRDVVELLLNSPDGKALVNALDRDGASPLYYAQKMGRISVAHYLRERAGAILIEPTRSSSRCSEGIDHDNQAEPASARRSPSIDAEVPKEYRTALGQVETRGWPAVGWSGGFSLLHWGAKEGRSKLCRYLLELGAEPSAKDDTGKTPVAIAREHGNNETLQLLLEAVFRARANQSSIRRDVPASRMSPRPQGRRSGEVGRSRTINFERLGQQSDSQSGQDEFDVIRSATFGPR